MKGVSMWETVWNLHFKLCDIDNYFNFSYELLVISYYCKWYFSYGFISDLNKISKFVTKIWFQLQVPLCLIL